MIQNKSSLLQKNTDNFQSDLYALTYIDSGSLRLSRIVEFSYDTYIRNRKFHITMTIDKHKDCKVRQELYRANQYEKPRQDAGVFY